MSARSTAAAAAAVGLALAAAAGTARAEDLDLGRDVYREHCEECHGKKGRGDGDKARRAGFRPRDFGLGAFKCRSTPTGKPPTDEDLARVVRNGLPGSAMLGRGDKLADEEIAAVVAYVKTLSPAFAGPPPEPIALPEPPEALEELAAEGLHVYQALRCWTCHGVSGQGDGPAAKGLVDDWGDPIRVFNFVRLKRFKCGGEPADLYRTLHTGLTGSPMPSYTEAFPFGREHVAAAGGLEEAYGPEEAARLLAWAAEQPESAEIEAVPPAEAAALVEHRTWALVAYLRSLTAR